MDCVLHECLGDSVPPSPHYSSLPCSRSFLPDGYGNPATEGRDSREHVE